ncbi:MAG TPA: CHAT domain-containing tetratricopeptide repeat protein [Myxococcota bacterium]|nr:CHAT domain-containing tetratricopeptide repeat protein [Myxococcota bacterium]
MLEARGLFQRSLQMVEKSLGSNHPQAAIVLNSLGYLEMLAGNYRASRASYQRALAIQEKTFGAEHPQVAAILIGLGQVSRRMGSLEDAVGFFARALSIAKKTYGPGSILEANILGNLGEIALHLGDAQHAGELYRQAIESFEKFLGPDNQQVYTLRHNLAHALAMAGSYDKALEQYKFVLERYQKTLGPDHPWVAQTRCAQALIQTFADRADKALPVCRRCIAGLERSLGRDHFRIAENLRCLVLANLRLGNQDKARRAAERTLSLAARNIDPLLDATSDRERLELVSSRRVYLNTYLSLFDRKSDGPNAYASVLKWKGVVMTTMAAQHAAALASPDPSLAGLLDKLNTVRRKLAEQMLAMPGPDEKQPQRVARFVDLIERRDELERALAKGSEGIRSNHVMLSAGVREICRQLGKDEVLVDYLAYQRYEPPDAGTASEGSWKQAYLAFVLEPDTCKQPQRVELGDAERIEQAVGGYIDLVQRGASQKRLAAVGQNLRRLVWDPVARHMHKRRKVWIVPDSALAGVPFGALPEADERYLIEKLTFGYLSAAQELARPEQAGGSAAKSVLIAGGIDYGAASEKSAAAGGRQVDSSSGLLPVQALPETKTEARNLAALFRKTSPQQAVVLLEGGTATEERVKRELSGKRFIHLATHGYFAPEEQAQPVKTVDLGDMTVEAPLARFLASGSGLILAGANDGGRTGGEDGLLTADEVSSADLRGTELVVLSACETGVGTPVAGEGVLGLRRAFFLAGARAEIMSLWKIPDEPTRRLMESFYAKALARKTEDKAEILRAAKLEMIGRLRRQHGRANPLLWAGFIVSGR